MAKSQQILTEDCHSAVSNITSKCNKLGLQYHSINQNITETNKMIKKLNCRVDSTWLDISDCNIYTYIIIIVVESNGW